MPGLDLSITERLLLKESQIFSDPHRATELEAEVGTVNAIMKRQTANISPIEGTQSRENRVRVTWLDGAAIDAVAVANSTANCNPTAPVVESAQLDYTLSNDIQKAFSTKIFDANRNNAFSVSEAEAFGLLKAKKMLDDEVNQRIIAALVSNSGINQYPTVGGPAGYDPTGVSNPTISYLTQAVFDDPKFFAYMVNTLAYNKMKGAFFLHGGNFNAESIIYELNALNDNERSQLAAWNLFQHERDLLAFSAATLQDTSFLIKPSSVAFASSNIHPDTPAADVKADKIMWTSPSVNIPGLRYDVTTHTTCATEAGNTREVYSRTHVLRAKFDLIVNPVHETGYTGILQINKGTRP